MIADTSLLSLCAYQQNKTAFQSCAIEAALFVFVVRNNGGGERPGGRFGNKLSFSNSVFTTSLFMLERDTCTGSDWKHVLCEHHGENDPPSY